ncbi:hypothetical protein [Nocardia lasii]|uniref:DUF4175 domain-containing protein n=1 Tax=Nocardia lasii TaxID=1616107 RepID=A0ABW1JMV1_9NOCA
MRIAALLVGLAVLGVLLAIDNWHPARAALYALGWLLAAVVLVRFARRVS